MSGKKRSAEEISNDVFSYTLCFDGSSKGNGSKYSSAGAGFVITGHLFKAEGIVYLGRATNNEAEYSALERGLECAKEHKLDNLTVIGDSQLVINQVNDVYKVNSASLRQYHSRIKKLCASFKSIEFKHVLRDQNKEADRLANEAAIRKKTIITATYS